MVFTRKLSNKNEILSDFWRSNTILFLFGRNDFNNVKWFLSVILLLFLLLCQVYLKVTQPHKRVFCSQGFEYFSQRFKTKERILLGEDVACFISLLAFVFVCSFFGLAAVNYCEILSVWLCFLLWWFLDLDALDFDGEDDAPSSFLFFSI